MVNHVNNLNNILFHFRRFFSSFYVPFIFLSPLRIILSAADRCLV